MASSTDGVDSEDVREESVPLLDPEAAGGAPASAETAVDQGPSQPPQFQPQPEPFRRRPTAIRQIFLGMIVALPSIPPGMSFGFSAIALGQLRLNVDEASWFASVAAMGYPVGSLLVGPLVDKLGRRPALLSINIVSLIGWLLLSVHTSSPRFTSLVVGRVVTGVAGGLASVPGQLYAAECLAPANLPLRSSLVTWPTVALSIGIFLVYALGSLVPYYAVASLATLTSIFSLILVSLFIVESPQWLASRGRHGDAEWSQRRLNLPAVPRTDPRPAAQHRPDFRELFRPEAYRPLLIMICFFFFQQFSGVYVVLAYMVDVVRAADVVTVDAYVVTALGGSIILAVSLLACTVYPKTGVRSVAVVSGAGIASTMIFLGIFHLLRSVWRDSPGLYFLNWVPFFVILANVAISSLGFLILPWSMLGEIFPLRVKGLAAGIATCLGFLFSFMAAKLYPYIIIGVGASGVFFFFGVMALCGTIFVILFLPETKGRTLEEIVDSFSNRSR